MDMETTNDASLDADVIIVGGGVTGCAMATALANGKRRILVLEARTGHKPRFAGELLHPTGTQVLDELGFLPTLRKHGGVDVDGFAVVKAKEVPVTRLPYAEIANHRPTGFAMEHRDLVTGMRELAEKQPGRDPDRSTEEGAEHALQPEPAASSFYAPIKLSAY